MATDSTAMLALTGGARDPTPLWLRDSQGWSQPSGGMPGFLLAVTTLPEGGMLVGAGRDIADQPGVYLIAGAPLAARRLYDAQAIGALAVAAGRAGTEIYAATAPWADRDASPDLLRRDPNSGAWSSVLRGTLSCDPTPSWFRQVLAAPSDSNVLLALEWCNAATGRQTQLWRSDDHGLSWQVLPHAGLQFQYLRS